MSVLDANLISGLPLSLSCIVLSEWTELKSLARLDAAFCNRLKRKYFLDMIQSQECVIQDAVCSDLTNMIQWAVLRNIRSTGLVCDESLSNKTLLHYLRKHEKHVTFVTLKWEHANLEPCRHILKLMCSLTPQVCGLLSQNPLLQELTLTYGLRDMYCTLLNQITLPELSSLSIKSASAFHIPAYKNCLISVIRMGALLRTLKLGTFPRLGPDVWLSIAQQCRHLQSVCFESTAIEDDELSVFVKNCSQITTFNMTNNDYVSDAGVYHVLVNLRQLRSLTLQNCYQLTDNTLLNIEVHCVRLEELYLRNVLMISSLEELRGKLPMLRVFNAQTVTLDGPIPDDAYMYEDD